MKDVHRQYKTITRIAGKAAQQGLGVVVMLDQVAELVLEHRRAYGKQGADREDADWAADLAIAVYEGTPYELPPRDCIGCGRRFTPASGRQTKCSPTCHRSLLKPLRD